MTRAPLSRSLYAMRSPTRHGLKIGATVDIKSRRHALRVDGAPLEVVYSQPAPLRPMAAERLAHWLLRDHRVGRSEWFAVDVSAAVAAISEAIASVAASDWPPPWPNKKLPPENVRGNNFPKRWTDTFQMRTAPEFLSDLADIARAWGKFDLTAAEVLRALVSEEKERLALRAAKQKKGRGA